LPGETDEIAAMALGKLAAAKQTEWAVVDTPVDPTIDAIDPGLFDEVLVGNARCTVIDQVAPVDSGDELDLPSSTPLAIRWRIDGDDARDSNTLPNDAADGGVVYGIDQSVTFVDPDGTELWRWDADDLADVDLADKVYVVASDEGAQFLVALDTVTGVPAWASRLPGDGEWSGVEGIGPTVYVTGRREVPAGSGSFGPGVVAFDAASGIARWQAPTGFLGANDQVALLDAGLEDMNSEGPDLPCALVAAGATTGDLLWSAVPTPKPFVPTTLAATIAGDQVIVASRPTSYQTEGRKRVIVQSLDIATGDLSWNGPTAWDPAFPDGRLWLVADDEAVYVQANMGDDYFTAKATYITALDRTSGDRVWGAHVAGGVGSVSHGLQLGEHQVIVPAATELIHLSTDDGGADGVETVPFEWAGELILTDSGPVLLSKGSIAAAQ